MSALPEITPAPPRVSGPLPWLGAGLGLLRGPTDFFAAQRARLGDSFAVDALGYRLFCVFSPRGVAALYAAAEDHASFGLATFELVFKHKLPLELALGRRNRPHDLFKNPDVETYLENLERAVGLELDALGDGGTFEAFREAKRLGYRLGLASWAGLEAASPQYLDPLIRNFDRLDAGDSFVKPISTLWSHVTGKRREWAAMRAIEAMLGEILDARRARDEHPGDFLDRIDASFADVLLPERNVQVARDVMLIQMGAQSNLPAALAWTLVNLLLHPPVLEAVRAGDDALLERCAYESIRLAQRSITLRRVLRPLEIETEAGRFTLAPGVFLATMLSVTNPTAAPGLDRFDPAHYTGRRLQAPRGGARSEAEPSEAEQWPRSEPRPGVRAGRAAVVRLAGEVAAALPARELVSTFGHGGHSCPAQRFSITAIRIAVRALIERFELTPQFASAAPRRRQIGGVARAEAACPVAYRLRSPRR